jgi:hypothetical protein
MVVLCMIAHGVNANNFNEASAYIAMASIMGMIWYGAWAFYFMNKGE